MSAQVEYTLPAQAEVSEAGVRVAEAPRWRMASVASSQAGRLWEGCSQLGMSSARQGPCARVQRLQPCVGSEGYPWRDRLQVGGGWRRWRSGTWGRSANLRRT